VLVRDDGCGFDPTQLCDAPGLCLGLSIMRNRAAEARGELQILSQPGAGTTVRLDIPLRSANENP